MIRDLKLFTRIRQHTKHGLMGRLILILCLSLITFWLISFTNFLCNERVFIAEYPSPDGKHSILVLEENPIICSANGPPAFRSEFFDEYYAITGPKPSRQIKEFYSRETYLGDGTYHELKDVRWYGNDHITYGSGQKTRYCNIHKLDSLEDCTGTAPKIAE